MLIFCEECGQKINIATTDKHSKSQKFRCSVCGDSVWVSRDSRMNLLDLPAKQTKRINDGKPEPTGNFKILVVDDSPIIRKAIRDILESSNKLRVASEAANGVEALRLIPRIDPDVVTMDINMPAMDGLTTLKHMMIRHPKPTVMISTLSREGASITFEALKFGAVDFIAKPSRRTGKQLEKHKEDIVRKVMMAARMKIGEIRYLRSPGGAHFNHEATKTPLNRVLTIGASEGGYSALLKIVPLLRPDIPAAVLVVLYTSEPAYVDAFVRYLDAHSFISVKRASNRERLMGGTCYMVSGNEYLTFENHNGKMFIRLNPAPFPNRRGAVNMMMMSAAEKFGPNAVGAVLSGAGDDGVEGLREILRQGGAGLVQDPVTCLCKDMALSVLKNLHIDLVVADRNMADEFNRILCLNHSIN
ncbi:MAG: chemotaxis protein CheB [Desulfobacterales bacterium]